MLKTSQFVMSLVENADRRRAWQTARDEADRRGRPLLNVGCPSTRLLRAHPCGDVCLDSDIRRLAGCQAWEQCLADVREIPYPAGTFGAALASHVLEHLPTPEDAERALAELHRVAEVVYVVSPSPLNMVAWAVPDHHLWVSHWPDGSLTFQQRHRGAEAGEVLHPLLERLWERKDAAEISLRTGIPVDRLLPGERGGLG